MENIELALSFSKRETETLLLLLDAVYDIPSLIVFRPFVHDLLAELDYPRDYGTD